MDLGGLRALLRRHVASDEVERGHVARVLALLDASPEPASRSSFQPGHLTASAFVVSADGRSLLLIHHRRLGRWLQPGGHVDPEDADLEAAARREVAEETGLSSVGPEPGQAELLDVDVHEIPAHAGRGEPAHLHFDVRWMFVARGDALQAGSDVSDARWVPIDEVASWETDASVRRAVARVRERLAADRAGDGGVGRG
ncbi:MAG TPA: NUDIX hydrolase [Myxococcota bacterium]|nr:NUDIX hydrolase [Myxococcota bacterium]